MRTCDVTATRQKKGIFGLQPAKAGHRFDGEPRHSVVAKSFRNHAAGVSGIDRCYEPAGSEFGLAIHNEKPTEITNS
jgi:hypothetical protein